MSKKDFEAIAATLREHRKGCKTEGEDFRLTVLCRALATDFAERYPRFKKDVFLAACGIQ